MRQFYINGNASSQYGIYCSSDTFLNSPAYAYEEYEVPNVNGAFLKYDKHLNNVVRQFDCFIKDYTQNNVDAFKKMLYSQEGYMRIESDYDPDTYQLGYLVGGIEFEPFDADGKFEAKFTLYFSCKPQKYFVSNNPVTGNGRSAGAHAIIKRNSQFFQKLASLLPLSDIPEGDFFALTLTAEPKRENDDDITVTSSEGNPIYYVGSNETTSRFTVRTVFGYSLDGNLSTTINYTTPYPNDFYVISPLVPDRIDWTVDPNTVGNSQSGYSYYGMAGNVTISKSDAVGGSPRIVNEMWMRNDKPFYQTVTGYMNGEKIWEGMIEIDFDQIPSDTYQYICDTFGYTISGYSGTYAKLEYDPDTLSVNAIDENGNVYPINEYVQIYGEIGGWCDEIKVYSYPLTNGGYSREITVTPNWWKV